MGQPFDIQTVDYGETIDETTRTCGMTTMPASSVALVKIDIIAHRLSDGVAKAYSLEAFLRRDGGNTVIVERIPTPSNLFATAQDETALSAATIGFYTDETQIAVLCTGIAGATIGWSVRMVGRGVTASELLAAKLAE